MLLAAGGCAVDLMHAGRICCLCHAVKAAAQRRLTWRLTWPRHLCRQLLLYPGGNGRTDALALYLAVAEDDQSAFGLQRTAAFKLCLLSSVEGGDIVKDTQHTFTSRETDWGALLPLLPRPMPPDACRRSLLMLMPWVVAPVIAGAMRRWPW